MRDGAALDAAQFGHLRHLPLGKEGVDHARPLRRLHQVGKGRAFQGQGLIEGQPCPLDRRIQPAQMTDLPGIGARHPGLERRQFGRIGGRNGQVAHPPHPLALGQQPLGKGQARRFRRAVHHGIDDAQPQRLVRRDHAGAGEDLGRGHQAAQARQALGAARAGDQAQVDLGQAQPGARQHHPVMAAQRHLQPAAQGGAVQDADHGFAQAFQRVHHQRQRGVGRGLAEFGDIGPGDEGPPFGQHHHGAHLVRRRGPRGGGHQTLPDRLAGGVDGRIVDADQRDGALFLIPDRFRHGPPAPVRTPRRQ